MIQNFDVPAWGGFNGRFSRTADVAYKAETRCFTDTFAVQCNTENFFVGPTFEFSWVTVVDINSHNTDESDILNGVSPSHNKSFGLFDFHYPGGWFDGWMPHKSLLGTVEGYNYLPISFSLITYWLNEISAYFVDGEAFAGLWSPGYQYKTGDSTNSVQESSYNLHYLSNSTDRLLPKFLTDSNFSGWDLSGQSVSGSFVTFLSKTFEQLQAVLAILTGGTLANFGQSDTSSRVFSAVSECMSSTDDGESLSLAERLARLESSVAQLIALTTYTYYVSGASVDSAPASGESVAEGVLNYLKTFLGSGAPAAPPEEEGGV